MPAEHKDTEVFLELLMINQRKIHSYILSLVPYFNDAEDIMQETISKMWKKFEQFEIGSDFASWGAKFAYYQVLNYRKKKARDILSFNDDIFEQISEIAKGKQFQADRRIEILRECVNKLSSNDRLLIKARCEINNTVKSLASQLSKSIQYVYKHLARIHYRLNICVHSQMREKGEI